MTKSLKILVPILLLGIIGYFVYLQIEKRQQNKMDHAIEEKRQEWQEKTGELEQRIAELQEELAQETGPTVPKDRIAEAFGEDSAGFPSAQEENSLDELQRQISAFFEYLDNRDYIKAFDLETGTHDLFNRTVQELSESLPMVTDETRDIVSLTRNIAHFYRVLGSKRIELTKAILANEADIIESVMATFFAWSTVCERSEKRLPGCAALEVLYEYAGFFLNTLAGKSYLLRRDSKIRLLTSYYSTLILDRAIAEKMNRNGLDIRAHIAPLLPEIVNRKGLIYHERYVRALEDLTEKYRM